MKIKNKKISLAVCSLLAMASIVGGAYSVSAVQDVVAESAVAEYVATDVATKSSWETAGYGTDGYLLLGSNSSSAKLAYSDMYTEQGNDGKTEITLYNHGNNYMYYEEKDKTTDATAPISNWVLTGRRTWTVSSASYAYPYIPGTTTQYPVRLHNGFDCPYKDIGLGFSLRETEKTYVSVYVMDWNNAVSETKPITVGLYNSIKTTTVFDTAGVDSVDAHYGTALAETTVTTNGTYVTFAIEEAGDYSIVAYYDNPDPTTVTTAPVQAMMTAFFFDLDGIGEEDSGNQGGEETPESNVLLDTRTQSSWEASGYGKDGYLLLGSNSSSAKLAYSDMYTEQGNDGKTEITLYNHGNNYMYYEEKDKTTDATAPISNWVLTGRRTWTVSSASYAYPYIPGTTTQYPVRLHNSFACPYKDIGLGFSLRETEKTYVSVYVMDWNNAVSETKPITVGLYSGIKTTTVFDTAGVDSVDAHYGTALAETTVTTNGTYVTFAIEEAGDYSIVAYYDNQDPTTVTTAPVQAMMTAFFFDKQLPEGLDAKYVAQDTTSKSAWEANGYGKDGYLILGGATSTKNVYTAYSNMYSKLGNDGKTEITAFYKHGNNHLYYNSYQATVDSTAPVSDLAWLGSTWTAIDANSVNNPYLYAPGTTTEYLARVHNGATSPNRDTGFSFTLRNVGKIYVSAYVMEWNNSKALDTNPITVALFKTDALFELPANVDGNIRLVEDYYGTPIAKTTVTTSGAYVTFALKEAGNYSIVAYYDNTDTSVNSPVIPSITGLFFDKDRSPALTSTSLSLEGDIGVNYYFGAQGQDLTGGYMQITYQNGATEQLFIENRNGDGTYKFQVKVAAKDYAVAMTAQLFNAEGVAISEAIEYSPAEYVASIIDAGAGVYGDKLIALVQALDDYGKAAANLFYGESNVLTADFSAVTTSTLEAYQFSVSGSLPAGVKLSDFSLSLKSTTSLKIYFTAKSLDGIVCKVGDTVIEPEATGATNEYCIVIENINAKDLDTNYVVSIGGYQLTLSTLSYSLRALEYSSNASLKTAMQALYLYNQAANAYFEEA